MKHLTRIISILLVGIMLSACSLFESKLITEEEATDIVLNDLGITINSDSYNVIKLHLDKEDKEYEISISIDENTYEYKIDAVEGKVLEKEVETLPKKTQDEQIVADKFLEKALTHFGFTIEEVLNSKVEKDYDDGQDIMEVSFYKDNVKYSCEFDVNSEQLLKAETDHD